LVLPAAVLSAGILLEWETISIGATNHMFLSSAVLLADYFEKLLSQICRKKIYLFSKKCCLNVKKMVPSALLVTYCI